MKILNVCIFLFCLIITSCKSSNDTQVSDAIKKGVKYIFSKQSQDGAWRSEKYQSFETGESLTPFILYSLSFVKSEFLEYYKEKIEKALLWMKDFLQKNEFTEHPAYSTALFVIVFERYKPSGYKDLNKNLIERLRGFQLTEKYGWQEEDAVYGGFDHGYIEMTKPNCYRPDISLMSFAIESLIEGGVSREDDIFKKAKLFLQRCQNKDGGFFFTTWERQFFQNKAGFTKEGEKEIPNSYGSATCDGLRALVFLNEKNSDAFQRASLWLKKNDTIDLPGGFTQSDITNAKGLFFYHHFSRSLVAKNLNLNMSKAHNKIISMQQKDGSWANEIGIMNEDDPLIATAFSLIALSK